MTTALVFALFLAQQVTPPAKCTLSGTVVDSVSGLPLGKVEVVAEHVGAHDPGASTTTDAKGNFLIVDVEPGQYRLLAQRNGYLDTYFGSKRSLGNGSTITLAAGQKVDDLQIKITPVGVIAGTVRDSDGEPLIGARVRVRALLYVKGQRGIENYEDVNTDDLGQYRVTQARDIDRSISRGDSESIPQDSPQFTVVR